MSRLGAQLSVMFLLNIHWPAPIARAAQDEHRVGHRKADHPQDAKRCRAHHWDVELPHQLDPGASGRSDCSWVRLFPKYEGRTASHCPDRREVRKRPAAAPQSSRHPKSLSMQALSWVGSSRSTWIPRLTQSCKARWTSSPGCSGSRGATSSTQATPKLLASSRVPRQRHSHPSRSS